MENQTYFCSTCNKIWVLPRTTDIYPEALCPDLDCLGVEIYPIDEQMAPVIKILNQKGYKTLNCCSCHNYEVMKCCEEYYDGSKLLKVEKKPQLNGYISFKECYWFDMNDKSILPPGWYFEFSIFDFDNDDLEGCRYKEKYIDRKGQYDMCLRMKKDYQRKDDVDNFIEAQYYINLRMNHLIRWTQKLKSASRIMTNDEIQFFNKNNHT